MLERPDQQALDDDLHGAAFRMGAVAAMWGLAEPIADTWPNAIVWVGAASRDAAPDRFVFRFDCSNYPSDPPTGSFWNPGTHAPLEFSKRPKGRGRVEKVFRIDWESGKAVYHPYDRVAARSHSDWAKKYPQPGTRVWQRWRADAAGRCRHRSRSSR